MRWGGTKVGYEKKAPVTYRLRVRAPLTTSQFHIATNKHIKNNFIKGENWKVIYRKSYSVKTKNSNSNACTRIGWCKRAKVR